MLSVIYYEALLWWDGPLIIILVLSATLSLMGKVNKAEVNSSDIYRNT